MPNVDLAIAEHLSFVSLLRKFAIEPIELFDLISQEYKESLYLNPNIIFTRDSLITLPWFPAIGILGYMQKTARQYENSIIRSITHLLGFTTIISLPDSITCEGGDVIPLVLGGKRIILIRTGGRTDRRVIPALLNHEPKLCDEVIEIHCKTKVLHLDTIMGFAGEKVVVYDPESVTAAFKHTFLDRSRPVDLDEYFNRYGLEVLGISYDEAMRLQATNYLNIGDNSIVVYSHCRRIINELERRKVKVYSIDGGELVKGRGGPRCLTRPLYA